MSTSHAVSRRTFLHLAGAAATSAAAGTWPGRPALAEKSESVDAGHYLLGPAVYDPETRQARGLVNAANDAFNHIAIADFAGDETTLIPTGFLGHSVAGNPARRHRAVMFGQRPGRQSCELDILAREVTHVFESEPGRHFYGHGAFSADGKTLFCTENNFSDGRGVIAVRDVDDQYKLIDEFPSHGNEPHEMRLLPGGDTFVIGNGGTETEQRKYKEVLESSVTFVDAKSGKLMDQHVVPDKNLSLRHLEVSEAGHVAVGIKIMKPAEETPPLLYLGHPGPFELIPQPALARRDQIMNFDLAIHEPTTVLAGTIPISQVLGFWHLRTKRWLTGYGVPGVGGVKLTPDQKYFAVSTTTGPFRYYDCYTLERVENPYPGVHTINIKHMTAWRV